MNAAMIVIVHCMRGESLNCFDLNLAELKETAGLTEGYIINNTN